MPAESPADMDENPDHQMALLTRAQKLYALSNTLQNPLDRATYLKELENVGGLLAYKVPEKSSMAKYLTLERREAVADQINRAILSKSFVYKSNRI
jgi:solute carrier family 66 (lysosomal lysine-arginine transporter), member 1